jgi:exo-poly-alpha-galacturonosidase
MTLQIDGTLRGSDNAADYPQTNWRFPYYDSGANFSGLINAYPMTSYSPAAEVDLSTKNAGRNSYYGSLTNIRICGSGTVNGSSDSVGSITGHKLTKLGTSEASAGGSDSDRGDMIACKGVNGLYIGGLTLYNPAMHTIFVSYSSNVTVNGLNISTYDIHNADGIDLCTTDTAYIFNSTWDCGDDCINLNAGQGAEGVADNFPDQNLRIFGNICHRGHGGVVFGSFTAAWIKNVLIEDCIFDGTDIGLRCKTGNGNGGGADNVTVRDLTISNIQKDAALFFDSTYAESGYTKAGYGVFKNFTISTINCSTLSKYGIYVNGVSSAPHTNLSFTNIKIDKDKSGEYLKYCNTSSFNGVTITNSGSSTVWSISSSSGLTFTGCAPMPAGY